MAAREWQSMILGLLDGVEKQLRPSAPKRARARLAEFRALAPAVRTTSDRRRYEVKLERFLQSAPYLRGAARRYLTPRAVAALHAATDAIKLASATLRKYRAQET